MIYTTLGGTGLKVSRMGLGCGGHSRLGLARGGTEEEAARLVREALDLGVNFIDTAEAYGTEAAVGRGLEDVPRASVVVSTKLGTSQEGRPATPEELRARVDGCLGRLRTDYVDVLHLHGVTSSEYPHARDVLLPTLLDLKAEGKVRHVGITEAFIPDPGHRMLGHAVRNDPWEVVMVGFSLLNPSARERVFPFTREKGIGTLCMFAVRRGLSQPEALMEIVRGLVEEGNEAAKALDPDHPLDFLTGQGVAKSLQEAAYRFCLWEPGIDVVLSGTGNVEHLRQNARAFGEPSLPTWALDRLRRIFGNVDSISGN